MYLFKFDAQHVIFLAYAWRTWLSDKRSVNVRTKKNNKISW